MEADLRDIKPKTPVASLKRDFDEADLERGFSQDLVGAVVGMGGIFMRKALGSKGRNDPISLREVLHLLDLDAFQETFVPRSKVPEYLLSIPIKGKAGSNEKRGEDHSRTIDLDSQAHQLLEGGAKELIARLPAKSVQCTVTSTPYWGMRLYDTHFPVEWADGTTCPFGHEQTPEGFIRHTIEILYLIKRVMKQDGSVWWNIMDTFNTRTQIRGNAAETLNAMKGNDSRSWGDYDCRRYSAGHSYLEDGELSLVPSRIAERASRIGYWAKSLITWKKEGSMPETVNTRVTREAEYILHLSLQRSPYFDKKAFRTLPKELGGRNERYEFDKVTDVWSLRTASGRDGHGAQFPLALPGRCIGLSSQEDDLVLDPFVGSGTASVAAMKLGRRSVGFDVDRTYLRTAKEALEKEARHEVKSGEQSGDGEVGEADKISLPLWQ